MSLETKLDEVVGALAAHTVALNANTAALGGKPKAATAAAAPNGKTKPPVEDKITTEMVRAAVIGVRDAFSKPVALALIKKYAKAAEIGSIKPSFYAAVLQACEDKMAELEPADEAEVEVEEDDDL